MTELGHVGLLVARTTEAVLDRSARTIPRTITAGPVRLAHVARMPQRCSAGKGSPCEMRAVSPVGRKGAALRGWTCCSGARRDSLAAIWRHGTGATRHGSRALLVAPGRRVCG